MTILEEIDAVMKLGTLKDCLEVSDRLHRLEDQGIELPTAIDDKWANLTDHIEELRMRSRR